MDFLKQYLGDELYAQLEEKLKGNDKVKLANLADGGYVAKKKYDDLETAKNGLQDTITELQKVDGTALQGQIDQLTKDNTSLKLGRKLDAALMDAKAVNITAVGALLDMSKISLDDSGKLVGADEQIKELQQSQAWAFVQPSVPGAGGNPPPVTAANGGQKTTWGEAINERIAQQ